MNNSKLTYAKLSNSLDRGSTATLLYPLQLEPFSFEELLKNDTSMYLTQQGELVVILLSLFFGLTLLNLLYSIFMGDSSIPPFYLEKFATKNI